MLRACVWSKGNGEPLYQVYQRRMEFRLDLFFYAAQFDQMDGGTYMHLVVSGFQRVAE